MKKEIEKTIIEKSLALKSDLESKLQQVGDVNFLATVVDLPNAEAVKTLAYALKGAVNNLFLVIGADFDGKPSLTVVISDELAKSKGLNAGNIIRDLAKDIQGGGGGQPFFATAGGKNSAGLQTAIDRAIEFIK
ncbi:Alanine--tRNA ligase [compost metagenome]